jgi:TRAP-type transport system periplasmic protein
MKKVIGYLIVLVTLASFILIGCSQTTPTSQPSSKAQPSTTVQPSTTSKPSAAQPAPTSASAPAPAAKSVTLKLGYDTAPTTWLGASADWWSKEVIKRTEGRVQIEVYPNSALAAQAKALDYLRAGMADIYILSLGTHAPAFPLTVSDSLAGIGFPTTAEGRAICLNNFMTILNKYPSVASEWKDFKVITYYRGADVHLLSKDKEIHAPADLKGVKVGSLGLRQNLMQIIGATPVMDVPPQAYEKLQTGVTQATCVDWTAIQGFQLWEVAKYYTNVQLGGNGLPLVISKASWEKVPAADQKILLDVGADSQKAYLEALSNNEQQAKKNFTGAAGHAVIEPTAAELSQWQQVYSVLWEKWIADQKAAGRTDASAILDEWKNADKKAAGR